MFFSLNPEISLFCLLLILEESFAKMKICVAIIFWSIGILLAVDCVQSEKSDGILGKLLAIYKKKLLNLD